MSSTIRRSIFQSKPLTLVLSLCFLTVTSVHAEFFTALTDMEDLLHTEAMLISNLEKYITFQQQKLEELKSKVVDFQTEHTKAGVDVTGYLSNPINSFVLTKRLIVDWKGIMNMVNEAAELFVANISQHQNTLPYPSDEDLSGAAMGLIRLQDTYNLDTHEMAEGNLNGIFYKSKMSSNDCFELGRQAYRKEDFHHTSLWMQEALAKINEEPNPAFTKADVLDYLAFCAFKRGDTLLALNLTNQLLELMPKHERAQTNKLHYEEIIKQDANKTSDKIESKDEKLNLMDEKINPFSKNFDEQLLYDMVCRGELKQSNQLQAQLKCKYATNPTNGFLKIAPLKLEEVNLEPYIVVYHQVLFDAEISSIKSLAKPKLKRAKIHNKSTEDLSVTQYRIGKSAFLTTANATGLSSMSKRLEDMTGLSMNTAEDLHVVNYGVGGHYGPHFDFTKDDFKVSGKGNRMATVLFYLTDVEQGGATVFPFVKVSIAPKKGSAIFWYNLSTDGTKDFFTRHASCPVLFGNKWIATKWIHAFGQELLRPCKLQPDSTV